MNLKSEHLLESLLDLERSRVLEKELRVESETLLKGLQKLSSPQGKEKLFKSLVAILRTILDFKEAFILRRQNKAQMSCFVSTSKQFNNSIWTPHSTFNKVFNGRPVAAFNVGMISEWISQPESVRKDIKSALHIGLQTGFQDALLIITHNSTKFFGNTDIRLAKQFAPLASQALLTLELKQGIIQRDRFFDMSMESMAIVDYKGCFQQTNSGWKELLKNKSQNATIFDLVYPNDIVNFIAAFHRAQNSGSAYIESRFKRAGRNFSWFACNIASYADEKLCYIVARDITAKKQYELALSYEASHDSLTSLLNRAEFMKLLQHAHKKTRKFKRYKFAILFLDLDDFKNVNDSYGHDVGDELLIKFADCLKRTTRKGDVVARMGGDEFILMLERTSLEPGVGLVAKRIMAELRKPFKIKGHKVKASTSIGIAFSSRKYENPEQVVINADAAMYEAKKAKHKSYVIFKE